MKQVAANSPNMKRNSLTNTASPLLPRHSFEQSSPMLKRAHKSPFERDATRTTMDSTVSRDTFFPEVTTESLNQTLESTTQESLELTDNASAGYISPGGLAKDFQSILSPTETVNLKDLLLLQAQKEDEENHEENETAKSIDNDPEISLENIPMSTSESKIEEWMEKGNSQMNWEQSDDVENDYLRQFSNEPGEEDSDNESNASSGSLDSLVTDKWLGQSLSQSQRVDRVCIR